jgi:hypothetical protein
MENQTIKHKWYQSTIGAVIFLILFFPVGLYLMWKYTNWNSKAKWVVTGFFGLIVLVSVVSGNGSSKNQTSTANTQTPGSTNTPSPTQVKQLDLKVTNLIVKRINMDGCRYFFALKDNETADFSGKVGLAFHKLNDVWPYDASNVELDNVGAGFNKDFYVDAKVCPNTFEKGGYATFSYEVDNLNGDKVFEEDGVPVTTQFEDVLTETKILNQQ